MAKLSKVVLHFTVLIGLIASSRAYGLRVKDEEVILDKLEDYQLCQRRDASGDFCQDALKRWVAAHPTDAFKAGKMARRAAVSWGAIPFFAQAFDANTGDCKDEDVAIAVESALDLPNSGYEDVVNQASKIGFKTCVKELKEKILGGASADGYRLQKICKEPALKSQLSSLKQKKCGA